MKAYVCDKCGKGLLIPDRSPLAVEAEEINRLTGNGVPDGVIELCNECVQELVAAVRDVKCPTET